MDVITKSPAFKDQICEMSVNQVVYFPIKNKKSIWSMISGPIRAEHPARMFVTRTVNGHSSAGNKTEKVLWVKRIS